MATNRQKGVKPLSYDEDTAVRQAPPPTPPSSSWWIAASDAEFTHRQRQRVQDAGWTTTRYEDLRPRGL